MKRISSALSSARVSLLGCLGLLVLCGAAPAADVSDPCTQFSWNVTHELAVFGKTPKAVSAGKDAGSAPAISADQLYELALTPQAQVSFAHPPSKRALNDGAYAGLARVQIPAAGNYRVAIDGPFWIDVLSGGKVVDSGDFTGNHGCKTLSKLVEFQLPAGEVLLQLSGAAKGTVHVAVTPSPKSKS